MRVLTLIGLLLAVAGGVVLYRGFSYTRNKSTLKLGDFEASLEQRESIPNWVGGVALAGGLVLIGAGLRRRS